MNKIEIEIFGSESELTSYESSRDTNMEFMFGNAIEGFVSIDGIVSPVKNGVCVFDTRLIDNGEYEPTLIQKRASVKLPRIIKTAGGVHPADYSSDFVRGISLRERRLESKVAELEMKIEQISKSIYGNTIF